MVNLLFFALSCFVTGVISGMLGPCKKDDKVCVQKTIGEVFPIVFGGIPSQGVDSSDPLFVPYIDGDLPMLKYKFINTTITGYKDCSIKNSQFDVEGSKLYFEMDCKNINMFGNYEINGKILIMDVQGKGTFSIKSSEYLVPIVATLKITEDNDGKSYASIKNFVAKPQAIGPVKFNFNNLFNGRKDLSDAIHKFADENYIAVAELTQDPIFNICIKILSKNINKFLKKEPLQEIFVDLI